MSGHFFKISSLVYRPYHHMKFANELMRVSTYLFEDAIFYEREVYNLVDLIGELGGVVEILVFVYGILIFPISKQSFTLEAAS
jgi:hypothetical protein